METQFSLLNVVNVVNGFHRKFWLKSALHLNIAVFTLNFLPYTGPYNDEEEVDSDDDIEYTEDAIDNMILEFSRD
jgi:hypothetical protein